MRPLLIGLGLFPSAWARRSGGAGRLAENRAILVTGDLRCGKTTLVETCLAYLEGRDVRIAGILAKGLWKDDLRTGFDLVNLADTSVTPLARRRSRPDPSRKMMFDFLEDGIKAGDRALDPRICGPADLVVVDEVGKLEARGEGWAAHISALLAIDGPLFLLVCRLDCLQRIQNVFGLQKALVIDARAPRALDRLCAAVKRMMRTPVKPPGR